MTDPRDPGSSEPRRAGAPSGGPEDRRPRKPRIEVLQRAPAAPPSGAGRHPGAPVAAASLDMASREAVDPPHQAHSMARRRRFRSPTSLLMLLASIVIAGFLIYTYLSNERDAADLGTGEDARAADADPRDEAEVDAPATRDPGEAPGATIDEGRVIEPDLTASSDPEAALPSSVAPAAPADTAPASADAPTAVTIEAGDGDASAAQTVRAFYSALGAGDGASAAQLVIAQKRRSGPLSAGELTRYYSSFRRPLRVRSVTPLDANRVGVTYDYILADGRLCRGRSTVNVVQRDGRSQVSGIRTQGPC